MSKHDSIVYSSCLTCGRHCRRGESYCGAHRPIRRGSGAARERFRREVLLLAGGRCEVVEHGKRCEVTDPAQLEAHHLRRVIDGGANDARTNGIAVCKRYHAMLAARAA